eukprot:tig00020912_g15820.t1
MALNAADMNLLSQHLAAASGVFAAAAAAPAPPHNANIHQVLQQILQQVQQIQPMQLQIQQMMQQQQQISHQQHQILNRMDNGTRGDGFDDPFTMPVNANGQPCAIQIQNRDDFLGLTNQQLGEIFGSAFECLISSSLSSLVYFLQLVPPTHSYHP